MNKGTGTYIAIIVVAVLAVAVFFLADFGGKIYASPEEVIEGLRTASQKGDMRGWFQCFTEESRNLIAADFTVAELVRDRNAKGANDDHRAVDRAVDKVFEEHGLTEEFRSKILPEAELFSREELPMEHKLEIAKHILKPVADRGAFVADLYKAIQQRTGGEGPFESWKNAKLSDVQKKGNVAAGLVTMRGPPRQVFFKKEGDSWRLDMIMSAEAKQPQMPPGHPQIER